MTRSLGFVGTGGPQRGDSATIRYLFLPYAFPALSLVFCI